VVPNFFQRPIVFTNAQVVGPDGVMASALRLERGRISSFTPHPRDVRVDLNGAYIYPGLINAHDHLELNNFPRLKWRDCYPNARQWIDDFRPRFKTDPALIKPMSAPMPERLFSGGLKNLLSGVTTVCHHNPLYRPLRRADFPVRVVQHYRWSHSLVIDGEAKVAQAYRRTPANWPWIIHAAEGTDAEARLELQRLEALECLSSNTVVVHGVGLSALDRARLIERGGGLIWCPASNFYTLGATADVRDLAWAGRVALGTDSRLSGSRDLLAEVQCAARTEQVTAHTLFGMVTADAARLLRLPEAGRIALGLPADLLVLLPVADDPYHALVAATRDEIALVMLAGIPGLAAPHLEEVFVATHTPAGVIGVDGKTKLLDRRCYARLRQSSIKEPGVHCLD
jgi:hypothetical protein